VFRLIHSSQALPDSCESNERREGSKNEAISRGLTIDTFYSTVPQVGWKRRFESPNLSAKGLTIETFFYSTCSQELDRSWTTI
jgi:hypothetical protein